MTIAATASGWATSLLQERDLTLAGLVAAGARLSMYQLAGEATDHVGGSVVSWVEWVPLGGGHPLGWLFGTIAMTVGVLNAWTFGVVGACLTLVLPVGGPVWGGVVPVSSVVTGTRVLAGLVGTAGSALVQSRLPATRNALARAVDDAGHVNLSIVIVDDSAPFRELATRLLARSGFDVVGTASSCVEALTCVAALGPRVALVDVNLGVDSGFDVARRLVDGGQHPATSVVLMSTHSADDLAELIARSPAVGFVAKEQLSGDAVRLALAGG